MNIYVINLASSLDRKEHIIKKAKDLDISLKFIDAVNGNKLSPKIIKTNSSNSIKNINRHLSPSEIGCYFSHLRAIESFLKTNDSICLILEDDIYFSEEIKSIIEKFSHIQEFPFDILLAGYRNGYCSLWHQLEFLNTHLLRFSDCGYGAHGYFLTRAGAKKILLNNSIPSWPYDYVTGGKADPSLKVYGLKSKAILLEPVLSNNSSIESQRNALNEFSRSNHDSILAKVKKTLKQLKPIKKYDI
ncbi:glycosyltransferase family 25 protein [Providencia rettgeri]|uniref:glycosyltransferase family 25 protein n=1 Tax=Providencia rettgeri TaxID=587 RepID=UPI0005B45179|nr:glycosyltransferase family 25 protein [Providencia rettgeri]